MDGQVWLLLDDQAVLVEWEGRVVVLTRRASLWAISLCHPGKSAWDATSGRFGDNVSRVRAGEVNQQERANPAEEVHV